VEDMIRKMKGDLETGEERMKRRGSTGCTEMQKRKRGELEKSGGTEEEIFKKSRLTVKSPDGKTETEREDVEEWRREMGERFDRLENWIKEFREGCKKQENRLIDLIEEIRKEYKNQGSEWEKEREKMRKDLRELSNRAEILEQNRIIREEQRGGGDERI